MSLGSRRQIVLGSRSPRRLELLRLIVPPERIAVVPPRSAEEPGFADARDWPAIRRRLAEIARRKCRDVLQQVEPGEVAAVIAADTVIVAEDEAGRPLVLGQPPRDDAWRDVVRDWFGRYLLGKAHTAATALCVAVPGGGSAERLVTTVVRFDPATDRRLEWYLATGEPRDKAGGYAIQGAGGLFVSAVQGSPSNVVGLPLRELADALQELGLPIEDC